MTSPHGASSARPAPVFKGIVSVSSRALPIGEAQVERTPRGWSIRLPVWAEDVSVRREVALAEVVRLLVRRRPPAVESQMTQVDPNWPDAVGA